MLLTIAALAGQWALAALSPPAHANPAEGQSTASTVVFAGDATYRPFHYLNGDGEAIGFDVELFRATTAGQPGTVRFELGDWGEQLRRLALDEVQVVPMFVTPERAARYLFSAPFLSRDHRVFGATGAGYVSELGGLSGHRVAVQGAGLAWEALVALQLPVQLVIVDVEADAVAAVAGGRADYAVVPTLIGYDAIVRRELDTVVALSPPLLNLDYAFAVSPARPELVAVLNDGLARIRGDGTYDRLYLQWLANLQPPSESFRSGLVSALWLLLPLLALTAFALWRWRHARRRALVHRERAQEQERLRETAEARSHELTYTDECTGLPNRRALQDTLPQHLDGAGQQRPPGALVRIDLLGLGLIKTLAGNEVTQRVLRVLGNRLSAASGDGRLFAVGFGEFAMILDGVAGDEAALARLQVMSGLVHQRIQLEGLALEPRCRAGVAMFPEHGTEAEALLHAADMACAEATAHETCARVYDPAMEPDPRNLTLIADLRDAIAKGDLGYALQPKIDLHSGRVIGAEMLVRWQHPQRGPLPPTLFVPLAERSGAIGYLTRYMVSRALGHLRQWRQQGLDLSLAVNASINDLADAALVDAIVVEAMGVGDRLILEITETDAMRDDAGVLAAVARLRSQGIRFSLDDFGTGHASFVYLRRLAPDELKIDRSFIADLLASPSDQAIVRTSIHLAHDLGATVTAEGIEDLALVKWLAAAGCDAAQGYALGRPMPVDHFEQFVRRQPDLAHAFG